MKKRFCVSAFVLAAVLSFGALPGASAASGFTDVPDHAWSSSYIQRAAQAGWVRGIGDGTFAPSKTLTGAEFMSMVANSFFSGEMQSIPLEAGQPWYMPYWTLAAQKPLLSDTSIMSPQGMLKQINRYDMAQIISNVMDVKGISADSTRVHAVQSSVSDWNVIPKGYREAVSNAYALGILNGKEGRFAGQDAMSRAEAATVLCKMADVSLSKPVSEGQQTSDKQESNNVQTQPDSSPSSQTPSSGSQSGTSPRELAAEVVRLVNVERAKEGLSPLETFDSLSKAAEIRAPELPTVFSHDRPDGSSCFTALEETGAIENAYVCGENIAAGSATAADVVEQWMNSPGHRANILNEDFTHIGVGYCSSGSEYRHYWVQMFVGLRGNAAVSREEVREPDTESSEDFAAEVVRLVNEQRAKQGISSLDTFDSLTESAEIRAAELPDNFSHARPDGTSCFTVFDETDANENAYTWGENIAAGSTTAADVVEQWMDSPGHRANILNDEFTHIGVGYYHTKDGYRHYWVQMFIGRRDTSRSNPRPR